MKNRWFPRVRFSLRTLLLCVLTFGSGATLWSNWGPWVLRRLNHSGPVCSAAISPDGVWLAVSTRESVFIRELPSGAQIKTLPNSAAGLQAAWSPDSRLLLTQSDSDTARLWDTRTWTCSHVLDGRNVRPRNAGFSPDGTRLITFGFNYENQADAMRLWDTDTGICLADFGENYHFEGYSPDSQFMLMAISWPNYKGTEPTPAQKADRGFGLWDAVSGKRLWRVTHPMGSTLKRLALSADGARVVCDSEEYDPNEFLTVVSISREYDVTTGALVSSKETGRIEGRKVSFTLRGWTEAFSPDGTRRVFSMDDQLALEDTVTHRHLGPLPGFVRRASSAVAEFTPDGKQIFAANYRFENDLCLWTRKRPDDGWGPIVLPEF